MKKKLVLAMAAAMAITSCAVPAFASDDAAGGGKIGISMPTQSLERWNRDGSYLEEQFKAAGYDVELKRGVLNPNHQKSRAHRLKMAALRYCQSYLYSLLAYRPQCCNK